MKRHLSLIHSHRDPEPPPPNEKVRLALLIGARMLVLLIGYVKGGCNNHDILLRAVGMCEAYYLALGMPVDGTRVADTVDGYLAKLQRLPDRVLDQMRHPMAMTNVNTMVAIMETYLDSPDSLPEMP